MNKFLKDLEKELKKLKISEKEIKEILEDHTEMIEAAKQEGLNEDEINLKFGDPVKVATEICDDIQKVASEINMDDIESLADFKTDDYTFVKAFNTVLDDTEFMISLVSDDFIMSDYDGEGIQVYQNKIKDLEEYEINLDKNVFSLNKKRSINLGKLLSFRDKSGEFLVLIPKGLKSKTIKFHSVSGDVVINGLDVNEFTLKSTNGDINLSNVNLGEAKLSLVNGDVEVKGFKALSIDISLVNGDVEFEKGVCKGDIHYNSVSGDAEFTEVECKNATFKTVSGDIDGKNFYVNEISLKSVSGDVEIQNDDKSRTINVKNKKTLSGDININ